MVFARDAETHRALNIQFEDHEAWKVYQAIVEGNPKWDEKVARHPLRANVGHKHRTMVDNKNGKPSETRFRVIKRYSEAALVEALKASFEYCDRAYAEVDDASAGDTVTMFGTRVSRVYPLIYNVAHDNEHYGNLVTYMRLNKMVPPSSQAGGM